MPRAVREGRRLVSAWALSIAAHAGFTAFGAVLVARSLASSSSVGDAQRVGATATARREDETVTVELPPMASGSAQIALPAAHLPPIAPPRGGGEDVPRPDTGRRGRGGSDTSSAPALNLADQDDGLLLGDSADSRVDRSQIQRIRSGRERASRESWRASREPMELTFLASGWTGTRPERRPPADSDPSAGSAASGAPTRLGGPLGGPELPPGVGRSPSPPGGDTLGAARASDGAGVRDGRPGDDHRASAAVPHARPLVEEGTPSVPAAKTGKPSDDEDAEQEMATHMQALLHASTAGGAMGAGPGGRSGPGAPGSGGASGPGSSSHALGTGRGPGLDDSATDPRRTTYERSVRSKLHPLWANAFPKWAIAEGLQGTVIVTIAIRADGSLASAAVTRPSGIPEFDENCRRAVLRAAPFGPLPPELGTTFRLAMAFDARNPAVRPEGAWRRAHGP
jgi:TonB family protein